MLATDITRVIHTLAPHVDAGGWADVLAGPMRTARIDTPPRIAMFLGQCAEETGGFQRFEEDLCYTTAARIRQVWPARFPDQASAARYTGHPDRLANHVYASRGGNGDEASGDGYRFRGRGLIQITFRSAYERFAAAMDMTLDQAVAFAATQAGAAASACWWWTQSPLLLVQSDRWDVRANTLTINGGLTNLPARVAATGAALAALMPPVGATSGGTESFTAADELNARVLATLHPTGTA